MLDFIVLGIVPGTTFTITLWWSLVFGLAFWLSILIYVEARRFRRSTNENIDAVSSPAQPA